ncbi:MAG: UDP-N-acetylglucosamine 2-epimerase (hydrolyzing) [SAR202 cluster bacterium]|nr:UDP-N-acetylglucosamine 2-epimerase (hydrolyzing) [SAR202 cluster bacterium]
MRTIGVITTSRADYGIYLPILRKIQADPELELHLMVTGMHLSPEFGSTVTTIEGDGFEIGERVEMLLSSDTPEGIAKSMGLGTIGFAQAYARFRPDILVVLGDRFEMHAAALAALPFKIPVAHIHGGELTQGAMDDALRHSITKLSHLHFAATEDSRTRLLQMGEEPWRVVVSGAPSLDNLHSIKLLDRRDLEDKFDLHLDSNPLLVTYHPVTLEHADTAWQVKELLEALPEFNLPVVFTAPNADTNGRVITRMIEEFLGSNPTAQMVKNFGTQGYFSLMEYAAAMVGNSSSGIIEAPSLRLPVVNIGTRQQGRMRGKNVIDVGYGRNEIIEGIKKAIAPEFRENFCGLPNPYGDGHASARIVNHFKGVSLDHSLINKRFVDMPVQSAQIA